ncbi:CAP domain-containing protein [Virgibacillus doumboii]|uniref:CAP domain-containing protein n=1 Tax=Virgibacillus doumboii TaxID=2697503 RepID=UPI0013E06963|nr:CAP domain-containing protein [Virgibacillus doumboii]
MKSVKLFAGLICLLFLVLTACNDNTPQSQNDDDTNLISTIKTDKPSQNYTTQNVRQRDNNNFPFGMFGLDERDQNRNTDGEPREFQRREEQNQQQRIQQERGQQEDQTDGRNQDEPQIQQSINEYASTVIKLTNQERRNKGLSELQVSKKLSRVARKKSQNMNNQSYFSHTSPRYGSPFEMMRQFDVSYQSAGENIARGQQTPQQVVDAWMNSQAHRENILNENFTHIGVGYTADGNYWTQMFIQK